MSLQVRLNNFITSVGTDYKVIVGRIGDLSGLTTTAKGSLVSAINEVKAGLATAGTTEVNDSAATSSTTQTYSANKLTTLISASAAQVKSDLVNGAGAALDTLSELANALGNDANFATTITNALGLRLRVDAAQSFNGTQQQQGQDNLNVYSRTQLGDPETDLVALYTTAKQ